MTCCLPEKAKEITVEIQNKALEKFSGLYDILQLQQEIETLTSGEQPCPKLCIICEETEQAEITAIVTPLSLCPPSATVTPIGVATEDGLVTMQALIDTMQLVHSLIENGDSAGALQALQPFQNVIPMNESSPYYR